MINLSCYDRRLRSLLIYAREFTSIEWDVENVDDEKFLIFSHAVLKATYEEEGKAVTGTSWPTRNRWKLNSSEKEEKFLILVDFMTA